MLRDRQGKEHEQGVMEDAMNGQTIRPTLGRYLKEDDYNFNSLSILSN